MKLCSKCRRGDPEVTFGARSGRAKGQLNSECNECRAARKREWRIENMDKVRSYQKDWSDANRSEIRQYYIEYRKNSIDNVKSSELKTKYGITLDDFNKLLELQENVCAICRQPETTKGKSIAVDHCHETDIVRGLLCNNCNNGLGRFKDNPEYLMRAAEYLLQYKYDISIYPSKELHTGE